MERIYQQGLLLLFLLIITSPCKVEMETFVTGYQGEDAVFSCFNSNETQPKNCSRVRWLKIETQPRQPKVILVRPSTPRFQDAERVKWEADKNGKMSFYLTKLQMSDEGLYRCEIWQGWDCIHQTNVSLKVKECKTSSMTTVANRPVELKCPILTDQQELKNISWVMLKGGNPSPIDYTRARIKETLLIYSMENRDIGWYRCQYLFKQNQRCFEINLLLQTQRDLSEEHNDTTVPTTVEALTTSVIISETQGEEISDVLTRNVATVTVVFVLCGAVVGLYFYCRRNSKAAQQTQRVPMDFDMGSMDGYEGVNLPPSDDSFQTEDPYTEIQPQSLCTFNY